MIEAAGVAAMVEVAEMGSDGEALKSRELILLLLAASPAPFSRHQFTPGHITCTGLVRSPGGRRVLLVHHRRLDRWLLPGGHVEREDAEIWESARREVREETGAVLEPDPRPPLISLDVHGIPPKRHEPYHLHHDLIFLFQARSEAVEVSEESRAVTWCAPEDFDRYAVPGNVRRAVSRIAGAQS
ncbi:MAG TPA: NUDIX domain-containing protein [Bryobacteraceae bacterium]|nr:NUDIX domain-containing protein [Bryobacteraceae bacterium]